MNEIRVIDVCCDETDVLHVINTSLDSDVELRSNKIHTQLLI